MLPCSVRILGNKEKEGKKRQTKRNNERCRKSVDIMSASGSRVEVDIDVFVLLSIFFDVCRFMLITSPDR